MPSPLAALALLALAHASGSGSTPRCSSCHQGGTPPSVAVAPALGTVLAGQSIPVRVSITTPTGQARAGFNLVASGGTLAPGDGSSHLQGGELTHNAPKPGAGTVTFSALWTAPLVSGSYTLSALGNAVDGDGTPAGDMDASAFATVTVSGGRVDAGAEPPDAGVQQEDAGSAPPKQAVGGVAYGNVPASTDGTPSGGCTGAGGGPAAAALLLALAALRPATRAQRANSSVEK